MKKILLILFALLCIVLAGLPCYADEEPVYIYTAEDMLRLAEDPKNTFCLMNDIDMSGMDWKPVVFKGVFRGEGHTIYNFNSTQLTDEVRVTYDGNKLAKGTHYDQTRFGGLFGILENAHVSDLNLTGLNINIDAGDSCAFAGTIAGIMYDSVIENCTAEGTVALKTSGHNFGTGGFAGCGEKGSIISCTNNITLICVDTDVEYKDEQFMGGAYSHGYVNVENCSINIEGFDSDHGYVHNGGIVGMFFQYDPDYYCRLNGNTVNGTIHFFEDNKNRRAYCAEYIGEIMTWNFEWQGNTSSFVRDETKDYSKDLMPHTDCDGTLASSVSAPDYENIGYTEYTCDTCGYTYRADYRLPLIHAESVSLLLSLGTDPVPGTKGQAEYILRPSGAFAEKIEFSSSDPAVITAAEDGELYVLSAGKADITVTVNGKLSSKVSVTVKDAGLPRDAEHNAGSEDGSNGPEETGIKQVIKKAGPLWVCLMAAAAAVLVVLSVLIIRLVRRSRGK